ncbi:MAG: hypothetical protein IJZ93_01135 [Clostridia bacterium]|nr:hypothetical protein [Clostridia bacterium]
MKSKFKDKFLNINTLYYICSVALIGVSVALTFFNYDYIITYAGLAWDKLKSSAVFFWNNFTGRIIKDEEPLTDVVAPIESKNIKFDFIDFTEIDIDKFNFKFEHLWDGLCTGSNFQFYNLYVTYYLLFGILYTVVGICILVTVRSLFEFVLFSPRDNPGEKTKSLKIFQRYIEGPFKKALYFCVDVVNTLWSNGYLKLIFCTVWAFNFNIVNFAMEFLSWYFTFPFSPTFKGFLNLISTFLVDFFIMLYSAPWWIWVILFGYLFVKMRIARAYSKFYHHENRNIGFINDSSRDWILVAPIRKGKDLIMTYCSLLAEKGFRGMAYDSIFKFKRIFPDFPWWKLERDLDEQIRQKVIKGPWSSAAYIRRKKEIYYLMNEAPEALYGYDGRMIFNDSYKYCDIWDELQEYARVYFTYSVDTPLIFSNMPIRTDIRIETIGNFPTWNDDMLSRTADDFDVFSRFCHNIDYDALRYGKHEDEKNENIGFFEFGINVYSEYDKERGNQITNAHMKYDDDDANPLNDKMDIGMKTLGHISTYDFKTYYMSFGNTQRSSSLMANDLELRDKMTITDADKGKLALPLYLEGIVISFLTSFYKGFDKEICYYGREQFTLPTYLINHLFSAIYNYDLRIQKQYGYTAYTLMYERAGRHNTGENKYVMNVPNKIAHNNRYPTDYLSPFFGALSEQTSIGILDIPLFEDKKPSLYEFEKQHSRFYNKELKKNFRMKK